MVGQTLGHFRLTARLGSGGMGIVYRAHDEKLQRTVAIKLVGRETGASPVDRARIVEEARASSGLNHPHICTVYETGEIDGQAYIAMEYVEGRPLSESIPRTVCRQRPSSATGRKSPMPLNTPTRAASCTAI